MTRKYRYYLDARETLLLVDTPNGVIPFHALAIQQPLSEFADFVEGSSLDIFGGWKDYDLSGHKEVFP